MKKPLLGVFIAILIVISISIYFMYKPNPQVNYSSNVNGLFANFTPYMNETVSYRLSAVNCNPTKYYLKDNQNVCLFCNNYDACFGFNYVTRESNNVEMNPSGYSYLIGNYDNITALNFYSYSIDQLLNCNKDFSCKDGINAKIQSNIKLGNTTLTNNFAIFSFPSNFSIDDINSEISRIASKLDSNTACIYSGLDKNYNVILSCGKLIVIWVDKNAVTFTRD